MRTGGYAHLDRSSQGRIKLNYDTAGKNVRGAATEAFSEGAVLRLKQAPRPAPLRKPAPAARAEKRSARQFTKREFRALPIRRRSAYRNPRHDRRQCGLLSARSPRLRSGREARLQAAIKEGKKRRSDWTRPKQDPDQSSQRPRRLGTPGARVGWARKKMRVCGPAPAQTLLCCSRGSAGAIKPIL